MTTETKQKLINLREFLKENDMGIAIDVDSIEYGVCDDPSADYEISYKDNGIRTYIKRIELEKLKNE